MVVKHNFVTINYIDIGGCFFFTLVPLLLLLLLVLLLLLLRLLPVLCGRNGILAAVLNYIYPWHRKGDKQSQPHGVGRT